MKKFYSLVAALVFTVAAMADTTDVRGYQYKIDTLEIGSENLVDYCLITPLLDFHFVFEDSVEIGTTYNFDQMYQGWCHAERDFLADVDDINQTVKGSPQITSATFTQTSDSTYTAFAKIIDGPAYGKGLFNITIAPNFHLTQPKDTVFITANSKLANRLIDKTATDSIFYIKGLDENNNYKFRITFQSKQLAGTYTSDKVDYKKTLIAPYPYNNPATNIYFFDLLPDALVTGDASNLTADINYIGHDSVLYVISFNYAVPVASEEKDFVASDLEIDMHSWKTDRDENEYNTFTATASNADYFFNIKVTTLNEWYNGTYTNKEAEVKFYNKSDSMLAYEAYTTNFTLAKNGTALSLTGTALCYGDVQFNINITGDASAVEEVEASDYVAYTEGHTIILNGAEGQNVAIYDIAGRLISNIMVNSDNARFEVAAGVYVISVNGQSLRVVVK